MKETVPHFYYQVALYPSRDGASVDAVLVPINYEWENGLPYVIQTLSPDDLQRIFDPLGGIRRIMENFYPDGFFGMVVMFPGAPSPAP